MKKTQHKHTTRNEVLELITVVAALSTYMNSRRQKHDRNAQAEQPLASWLFIAFDWLSKFWRQRKGGRVRCVDTPAPKSKLDELLNMTKVFWPIRFLLLRKLTNRKNASTFSLSPKRTPTGSATSYLAYISIYPTTNTLSGLQHRKSQVASYPASTLCSLGFSKLILYSPVSLRDLALIPPRQTVKNA